MLYRITITCLRLTQPRLLRRFPNHPDFAIQRLSSQLAEVQTTHITTADGEEAILVATAPGERSISGATVSRQRERRIQSGSKRNCSSPIPHTQSLNAPSRNAHIKRKDLSNIMPGPASHADHVKRGYCCQGPSPYVRYLAVRIITPGPQAPDLESKPPDYFL